jgi:hypothetical protein
MNLNCEAFNFDNGSCDDGGDGGDASSSYPDHGQWAMGEYLIVSDACELTAYATTLYDSLPTESTVQDSSATGFTVAISDGTAVCTIDGSTFTCEAVPLTVEDIVTLETEVVISGTIVSSTELALDVDVELLSCSGTWCGLTGLGPYPCHTGLTASANWSSAP